MDWQSVLIGIFLIITMTAEANPVYALENYELNFGLFDGIKEFFASLQERIISALTLSQELSKINQLYSEFPDVKARNDSYEKNQFNTKVNSLNAWSKYCSGYFNIDNFDHTELSFQKLADDYCPPLQNKSIAEIKSILGS